MRLESMLSGELQAAPGPRLRYSTRPGGRVTSLHKPSHRYVDVEDSEEKVASI